MPNSPITPELLDKYLSGQCSPEESAKVEEWYAMQPGEKNYLARLSDLERQLLEEETLKNIHTKIGLQSNPLEKTPRKMVFRRRLFQLGVAASLLLAAWSIWYFVPGTEVNTSAIVRPKQQQDWIHFVNKEAKLITHVLPDGTEVCLHPNAELVYPQTFRRQFRQIVFNGEGFFAVAHDASRPFFIQSDKMQIRVLGTKFNVKALPNQAIFQVAVVSGSVAVRSIAEPGKANLKVVILKPNQQALFEVATQHLTTVEIFPQAKKEIFEPVSVSFYDAPLAEVAKQLERQFKVRIQLADQALSGCTLTADFSNQNLSDILEAMCETLDATYTLSGDILIFNGLGCE